MGFGFAFLPSIGPFLAIFVFIANRWTPNRTDILWALSALAFALVLGMHQGFVGIILGALQILSPWLIYRAFFQLRSFPFLPKNSSAIALGLGLGLALVVILGFFNIDQLNFSYKTLSQVIIWANSPSLYGHTVFVLGALITLLAKDVRLRFVGLSLSALGILFSGSREAAIAWVFIAISLLFLRKQMAKRSWIPTLALFSAMLVMAAGLGPYFGWGRVGFLLDLVPSTGSTQNLIQGSEIDNGDWWDTTWVNLESSTVMIEDKALTSYHVSKKASDSWLRLQQVIPIKSGQAYTVSVWIKENPLQQSGIQGWGKLAGSHETFTLTSALVEGEWQTLSSGPGQILQSGTAGTSGEWKRVFATFVYEGQQETLYWYLGLAPDQRDQLALASFAGFQLEEGADLSNYTPGTASRGLGFSTARIPYWQAAWQGIKEKPLLGWGPNTFSEYYQNTWPSNRKLQAIPSHVHNLYLQTLFDKGLVGLFGLLLFIFALLQGPIATRDFGFLAVIMAILFINTFDLSLFYGGVLYPLAAVLGWRTASRQTQPNLQETTAKQWGVRVFLACTDFVMVYAALGLSLLISTWFGLNIERAESSLLIYALLLWPAMAWREGLYPGYGLTAPQELRKQVTAAIYASLILTAGVLLFDEVSLARLPLISTLLGSLLLLPLGRTLNKLILHNLGLWGRPIVILGAGQAGRRVAKALNANPLDGLHPVAFFDDDSDKLGTNFEGLPVIGPLNDAGNFAQEKGVKHAIVTVTQASAELLTSILNTKGQAFSHVQFVPDLAGLPIFGVNVSSLDKLLALEVRNELASPMNRLFKRSLDLVGVSVGGLLISPILLFICVAIYLDSPGPIFFGHKRIGKGGKSFKAWKFRTMVPNAQALLEDYLDKNPELRAEWEANQKLQNDPRVTRVGKFLRKYSLDELAQLWNVFVGNMSLVGPRPIVNDEIEKYDKAFELYTMVRPGMTGYWQVSGRSDTNYPHRVELDSFYVRNWSVWLDIVILAKTPNAVVKGEGAY